MVSPFMADAEKLAAVREALPSLGAGIQLDAATAGPLPAEVAAAMSQLEAYERDVGRADEGHREDQRQRLEEARAAVAAVVSGGLDAVSLTHGATEAIGLALDDVERAGRDVPDAGGVRRVRGARDAAPRRSRALITSDTSGAIRNAVLEWCARTGAEVTSVELQAASRDNGDADPTSEIASALASGIDVLVVPHVSPLTGRVLPIRRLAELAQAHRARLIVDGSQAVGAIPVDVEALGADAYAIAGHRWLLGPEGIGGLWRHAGDPAAPEVEGRRASAASRLHPPSVVGLARSIGWLSMFVSLDFVHRRGAAIAREVIERLAAIDGIEILTPAEAMATIVTFRLRGWQADAALHELSSRTFLIARSIPSLDAIRLSPGCWTTTDELDRVAEGIALVAGHTPETLPRRQTLAMLGRP